MLSIVMCKSVDFRTVSDDGGWKPAWVPALRLGTPLRVPVLRSACIGSGLISRLIMIQAKLSVFRVKKR